MTTVLQITDLHLIADRSATLKDVCTYDSLVNVLSAIRDGIERGEWECDWLVISGDLAHDEQLATYELLCELLGDWVSRCRLIPGNHDNREFIRRVFPELLDNDAPLINFSVEAGDWRLIGLDSHQPGEVPGRVDSEQLSWLSGELRRHRHQPTAIFVHHPPFPVGSAWIDQIGLLDPEPLVELLQASPQVRIVSTGHVHQEFTGQRNNIQLFTTPSTGVQFAPRENELVVDSIPAGFRLFHLDANQFETRVIRVSA